VTDPNPKAARVAVITGGSGGIGAAAAVRLAADGLQVVVHYSGSKEKADDVVARVESGGGAAVALRADVGEPDEMAAVFEDATKRFGGVDVVVNAAGIMPLGPIAEMDLETFDRIQRVNLRGTFITCQLAARQIRAGGAIINFSSSVARLATPSYGAYAASKGAIEAMTLILAREMKGKDVTVNAVAPGPTGTPLFLEGKSEELINQIASANPFGRLGVPEDIAEVIAFLTGDHGRWVNGQVLRVNGGMT
jgi:3-oxoacyl-[acyl-carrier protein] reductase